MGVVAASSLASSQTLRYFVVPTRAVEPYACELHVGNANGFIEANGDDTKLIPATRKFNKIKFKTFTTKKKLEHPV